MCISFSSLIILILPFQNNPLYQNDSVSPHNTSFKTAKHGYLLALPTVKAKRTVAGYESRNPHLTSYLVTTVYEYATVHVADLFGLHLL
jgi:hypothetical protein